MKLRSHNQTASIISIHLIAILILSLVIPRATAQLAITEVMSFALGGPDFWELTNFGDTPIDLTGYSFNDASVMPEASPFKNLTILAGQSVIFSEQRTVADTPDSFRAWWGLSSDMPVVLYSGHGLNRNGETIRLWSSTNATDEFLVDLVNFSVATTGFSFTYNPENDAFDGLSASGVDGAFIAATTGDVGSPGTPPVRVTLAITAQPTNTVANGGDTVTLVVRKRGMPQSAIQWFFNGDPIPGARSASLTLTDVQIEQQGDYRVVLSNYFEVVRSATARLTVNLTSSPPRWLECPADQVVFEGQSPTFRSAASGWPQPDFQWYFNDVAIQGAREKAYTVYYAQIRDTGAYKVVASNTNGAVTNVAQLMVMPRPDLQITEAMTSRTTIVVPGKRRADWWELTNFETARSIDLFGYRFDEDNLGVGGRLALSWTNTNHVIIGPGESIIFVQDLEPVEFRDWWGPANLPLDLQIITYSGSGFGLDPIDEAIYFWNPGATADNDLLTHAEWFTPNAPLGVSFVFDMNHPEVPCCDQLSIEGENGAVAAASGGDVGSPGYIRAPPEPRILSIRREAEGCMLVWRAIAGRNCAVQWRTDVNTGIWTTLASGLPATGGPMNYLDTGANEAAQRFYRVILEP